MSQPQNPSIAPQPDHWFAGGGIPVFKPSMEEFCDFVRFVQAVEPYALAAGLCKVIPPKEWRDRLEALVSRHAFCHDTLDDPVEASAPAGDAAARSVSTPETPNCATPRFVSIYDHQVPCILPIAQHFYGNRGHYRQVNIEAKRTPLSEFCELANSSRYRLPGSMPAGDRPMESAAPKPAARKKTRVLFADPGLAVASGVASTASKEEPDHSTDPPARKVPKAKLKARAAAEKRQGGIVLDRQTGHILPFQTSPDQAISALEAAVAGEPSPDLEKRISDYEALERRYWKNLTFNPPVYGADVAGSLFPALPEFSAWNLRDLGSLLSKLPVKLPGVNEPYLYFGMWRASFSWHVEDMDLYSINYLHFGAPKSWYCIPPDHATRFERLAQSIFSQEFKECAEFLRHKSFHISPSVLSQENIPYHKVVQEPGEFVLTFPHGYHAGFNQGFNCAESCNFALPRWVPIGRQAKRCRCVGDSVSIDVEKLFPDLVKAEHEAARKKVARLPVKAAAGKPGGALTVPEKIA